MDKTLLNCFRVRLLNAIFPDAKFVHIIRDGRAVAFSILNKIEIASDPNPLFHVGFKHILGDGSSESQRFDLIIMVSLGQNLSEKEEKQAHLGKAGPIEICYENLVTDPYRKSLGNCKIFAN